jgi:phosphatidate cytidylyltransferase
MKLALRLVSAAALIALVLGLLFVGGVILDLALLVVALGAGWEVSRLAQKSGADVLLPVIAVVAGLFALHALAGTPAQYIEDGLAVLLVSGLIAARFNHRLYRYVVSIALGAYVGFVGFFLDLYRWPNLAAHGGLKLVVAVIACAALADTGAYLTGSLLGRHKLAPKLSPSKTVEGAIGGCFICTVGLTFLGPALIPIDTLHAAVMGLILSVVGQAGDLVESSLKRHAGVKDSSNLIPGHGGLLDRLDSLLFVAPIACVYLRAISFP